MAQTTPNFALPNEITLEFHQVEPSPDDDTRRIKIGCNDVITSSDRLCVVEIHNMQGEALATLRLRETSRWLAQNNYQYVPGTNGIYRRASNWGVDWNWLTRVPKGLESGRLH
jgi:hypothetical protein